MKRKYRLYAMNGKKKVKLLATFYHLRTAKEIINTAMTTYDLALYENGKKIYSIN